MIFDFPDFEVFQSGRILETRYSKKDNMEKSLADMNFAKISEIFWNFKILKILKFDKIFIPWSKFWIQIFDNLGRF